MVELEVRRVEVVRRKYNEKVERTSRSEGLFIMLRIYCRNIYRGKGSPFTGVKNNPVSCQRIGETRR